MLRAILSIVALLGATPAPAQEAPPRAAEAVAALALAQWRELEPGLSVIRARTDEGVMLTAFRVDQDRFRFEPVLQTRPDGELVEEFAGRVGAVLAVNGGFFGEREQGRGLFAVGFLRLAGKVKARNWQTAGGYILFESEGVRLLPAAAEPPPEPAAVLQSKPMMIEPGGKWAMNTNQGIARPRTAICTPAQGREAVLLVASGAGLSLFEAAWLMRPAAQGGFFGCDAALALDGGGSTQLFVAEEPDLSVEGETAVHNALALLRR